MALPLRFRIAVVGDVHNQWDPIKDELALQKLKPDLVLFTGDFGDLNFKLVDQVGKLNFPKLAILGNHDCWPPAYRLVRDFDPVDLQLKSLGEHHIGYKRKDLLGQKLSIIGGRPLSCGGDAFSYSHDIVVERWGVKGMEESAKKIEALAMEAPREHGLIFLAHNGPAGLGSSPADICGKDWIYGESGDHGDPDLAMALQRLKEHGTHDVLLVIFGHMHKALAYGGYRTMLVKGIDQTIYLNAAVVPRVIDSRTDDSGSWYSKRNFTIVDLEHGQVQRVAEVWVVVGEDAHGDCEETVLYSA